MKINPKIKPISEISIFQYAPLENMEMDVKTLVENVRIWVCVIMWQGLV